MEKICWANTNSFDDAQAVIFGIPDESKSHAQREGTSEAPDKIRHISNLRDSFSRDGKKSLGLPCLDDILPKTYDFGNIQKSQIPQTYQKILSQKKTPIAIGGDHSITADIIKQVSKTGKISLVYFDAHPDFVSSTTNYYGSVVYDSLPYIDVKSSIQVGIRTPEKEELDNLKKYGLEIITPFDIAENGIKETANSILSSIGDNVYISFDMDCIDPAFAPGVSVPVPMGLYSTDATYLLKKIVKNGIIGIDIMEVCPSYDIRDRTSHLASRMIADILGSI